VHLLSTVEMIAFHKVGTSYSTRCHNDIYRVPAKRMQSEVTVSWIAVRLWRKLFDFLHFMRSEFSVAYIQQEFIIR
jgi:hypothetical protein